MNPPDASADSDERPLSELTAEMIWDAAPDGFLLIDDVGTVAWTNPEADRVFGYPRGFINGRNVDELVPESSRSAHADLRASFGQEHARRPMGAGQRLTGLRADGGEVPVQISLSPLQVDGRRYTIAAVRDVTDIVLGEDRLAQATRRRLLAEDHERLARELHDTVIQELFALGMTLQAVVGDVDQPVTRHRIEGTIDALDSIITEIRSLVFDVHRSSDAADFRTAIMNLAADLTPLLGFEPRLSFVGDADMEVPEDLSEHLLPTLREALTNVAKHADASAAHVIVRVTDHLELCVIDDGLGIPTELDRRSGLANLARRAALLGGDFVIKPADDAGTELLWRVPLARRS